jgi:hypothetical protein
MEACIREGINKHVLAYTVTVFIKAILNSQDHSECQGAKNTCRKPYNLV